MEEFIQSIELDNNLTLKIYDASKKIAGDRWQVTLLARMAIAVEGAFSQSNDAGPAAADIKAVLGDTVTYEIQKQRNFIGETEKPVVFKQLLDTFVTLSTPYLAHPEFPGRYILRQYYAKKKQIPC